MLLAVAVAFEDTKNEVPLKIEVIVGPAANPDPVNTIPGLRLAVLGTNTRLLPLVTVPPVTVAVVLVAACESTSVVPFNTDCTVVPAGINGAPEIGIPAVIPVVVASVKSVPLVIVPLATASPPPINWMFAALPFPAPESTRFKFPVIWGLMIIALLVLVRNSSELVVVSRPGTVLDPSVFALPVAPPSKPPEASVNVSFAFRKLSVIALFFDIVSELIVLPPVGSVSVPAIATLSVEDAPEILPVNSEAPGSIRIPLESTVAKPQLVIPPYGSAPDTVAQPPMIPLVSVGALVNFTNGLSPIAPAGDKNVTVEPVERVIEFRFMVAVPMPELPTFTRNTLAPPASVRLPKVIVPSVPLRLM